MPPAAILTLMYEIVANERGISSDSLKGTCQNDILKEYISRGTYIYPPEQSMRLVIDLIEYSKNHLPNWNSISISGYHMSEAGASPVQEIAFTFANARAYIDALLARGIGIDEFAPRLSFFFVAKENFVEQVCKFRLAREIWAEMMTYEYDAKSVKSTQLRFHAQTAGVELTAQNSELNITRVTIQAIGAILGGAQSLHTNSFDEAISLPSEFSVGIALKTQQILAFETDITSSPDPFGGSYLIEAMTDKMKVKVKDLMLEIEDLGGATKCIERNYQRSKIEINAYEIAIEAERVAPKMNAGEEKFHQEKFHQEKLPNSAFSSPMIEDNQVLLIEKYKLNRDLKKLRSSLQELSDAANLNVNLIPYIKECLLTEATLGEISDTLKSQFGTYHPTDGI